jgi:hypothetical protein
MEYTTKKPLKCEECKSVKKEAPPKAKSKSKRGKRRYPKNKNTEGELSLFSVLEPLLGSYEYINHGFYSFLRSPKNSELQIDRYYPQLRLGFEFDGSTHTEYKKYIHKSVKNFQYYQECDRLKDIGCKKNNVTLIRIAHNEKITEELVKGKIYAADAKLGIQLFGEEK